MPNAKVVSVVFKAADFAKAITMRENGMGIIRRMPTHPTLGVRYEVILFPKHELKDLSPYKDIP